MIFEFTDEQKVNLRKWTDFLNTTRMFEFTDEQKVNLRKWADFLNTTRLQQGTRRLFTWNIPCSISLREGDYSEDVLCNNENYSYCCLGIFALISHPESIDVTIYDIPVRELKGTGTNLLFYLPSIYQEELGIDGNNRPSQSDFSFMNDVLKWSFKQIAEEIYYILEHNEFSEPFKQSAQDYAHRGSIKYFK